VWCNRHCAPPAPGDLSFALPYRHLRDLLDMLDALDALLSRYGAATRCCTAWR
jgi:uncharacterized FAD-dependent dehydrogenase